MSEAVKVRRTKGVQVIVNGRRFEIPKLKAKALLSLVKGFEVEKEFYTVDEVFAEEFAKYGKPGYTLQGARAKAGMTQTQLAKKTGIQQSHISEMEKGKRTIGVMVAKKLADILDIDYKVFL